MRHDGLPPHASSDPSWRWRAFGAILLPLMLALALPACGNRLHECNGAPALPAPALTLAHGVIYAQGAGSVSSVAALRAGTGKFAWRSPFNKIIGNFHPAPPVVANGVVIASTESGIIAHHLSDGSLAWQSQAVPRPGRVVDGGFLPHVTVAEGIVYAAASSDSIAAWRVADGTLLWQSPPLPQASVPDPASGNSSPPTPVSEPVVAGNVVYFVAGRVVRAVRATDGSSLWSAPVLPAPDHPGFDRATPPVLAEGRLFIVATDGSLYALNAATGAVLWHAPDPDRTAFSGLYDHPVHFAPPIVRDGVVYYAPIARIRALDTATGHPLWQFPMYICGPTSVPVIAGGVVYVTMQPCLVAWHINTGGALMALDAHTGAMRWIAAIQPSKTETADITVLVHGDTIYTVSPGNRGSSAPYAAGVVAAWNASTGARLWQRAIQGPAPEFQQVVLADGVIYLSMAGVPNLQCAGIGDLPAISALRASDGALLWQTSLPPTSAV